MSEQTEIPLGEVTLAEALAAGIDAPREKWARTLAYMVDVLCATFQRAQLDEDSALDLAQRGVIALAESQGGRPIYLPRGEALRNAVRDRLIYRLANRNNIEALAQRFDVSVRRIEQIVAEQHALHLSRVQGRLFSE